MDDLIRRQAVADWLQKWNGYLDNDMIARMQYRVVDIPSAQPERKKGKWIQVINGRGGHECNQCHGYAPSYQSGEEHLSDFCPNCGAEMRKERR